MRWAALRESSLRDQPEASNMADTDAHTTTSHNDEPLLLTDRINDIPSSSNDSLRVLLLTDRVDDRRLLLEIPRLGLTRRNVASGLRRTWLITSVLWITWSSSWYFSKCFPYNHQIACLMYSQFGKRVSYIYTFNEVVATIVGLPLLAIGLGIVAFWGGIWIIRGFRPPRPRKG